MDYDVSGGNPDGSIADSITVKSVVKSEKPKWTFLVYMAADSDISYCALYDIVSMQQANIDSEIEVYVLADRAPVDNPRNGDYVTPYGIYQWDSIWPDTRVGKITYSPGLTVTVDWESWGELETGSIATLERFVNWAQEKSPAENYGLIVWDHGRENTTLCFDITTYPDREACFTVSELSDLLKEKGTFPLVILNNCMLGSELVVTQMAGSTDVIVVSEPLSYGMSTYNYSAFFNTITVDMTAQEMAAIMVQNVESPGVAGVVTMLTSVDVTVSRLAEPTWAVFDHCIDQIGCYIPISGDSWAAGQFQGAGAAKYFADTFTMTGYKPTDFRVYAGCGSTSDMANRNLTPQIDAMKNYPDIFKYCDNFKDGNLYLAISEKSGHDNTTIMNTLYNGLPKMFE